jgi:glycosyltransferase family protein
VLFKWPRRLIKHALSAIYPIVLRIWPMPTVLSVEMTIDEIAKNRKSIARFGDGEVLYIVNKLDLPFQEYNAELANRLSIILRNEVPSLLVGLPDGFRAISQFDDDIQIFWRSQISMNYPRFFKYLNLSSRYWNANITRLYYGYKDQSASGKNFEAMRGLWKDRDILLIEGEKSRLGVGNDLFDTAISVKRILGPAHHAFRMFHPLKEEALKYEKSHLVLIAMGPTAKALSHELTQFGYQCIDVGNLDLEYEWYRRQVKERIAIPGKYTSEVAGGRIVADVSDNKYHNQVVARFLS